MWTDWARGFAASVAGIYVVHAAYVLLSSPPGAALASGEAAVDTWLVVPGPAIVVGAAVSGGTALISRAMGWRRVWASAGCAGAVVGLLTMWVWTRAL